MLLKPDRFRHTPVTAPERESEPAKNDKVNPSTPAPRDQDKPANEKTEG